MDCECLAGCPFFHDRMSRMPSMSDLWKQNYCQGDSLHCARHIVFASLGKESVPPDLYPNEVDRARSIVSGRR